MVRDNLSWAGSPKDSSLQTILLPCGGLRRRWIRQAAQVPLWFGLLLLLGLLFFYVDHWKLLPWPPATWPWQKELFLLRFELIGAIPVLLISLGAIRLGLLASFGQGRLRLKENQILHEVRWGVLSRKTARTAGNLKRLTIQRLKFGPQTSSLLDDELDHGLIIAEFNRPEQPMWVGVGLPVGELKNVAEQWLSMYQQNQLPSPELKLQGEAMRLTPAVKAMTSSAIEPEKNNQEIPAQPPGSRATLERRAEQWTVTLPAPGLLKGSKGLFVFALLWDAFVTLFTCVIIIKTRGLELLGVLAFLSIFWAIGAGLMLYAIQMGRRRAVIDVVGSLGQSDRLLLITQTSLFGPKQHEWPVSSIQRIFVGASDMKVNDRPVMNLHIETHDGTDAGFFMGRDEQELDWLAGQLRLATGLSSPYPLPPELPQTMRIRQATPRTK